MKKAVPSFLLGTLTRAAKDAPPGFQWKPIERSLSFVVDQDSIDQEKRTVNICFSSEAPVFRWGVNEVLSHEPDACDLTRLNDGAAVLFMHDMRDYLGNVLNARIEGADRKGRATLQFNDDERGRKIFDDIVKGVLRYFSVGYQVNEWRMTGTDEQGVETWTAAKWTPHEISVVTVPADINAGVGRSKDERDEQKPDFNQSTKNNKNQGTRIMNRDQIIALLKARNITVADDVSNEALNDILARSLGSPDEERKKIADTNTAIQRMATEYKDSVPNASELALRAISEGKSAEEFQGTLLKALHENRGQQIKERGKIGLSNKEAQNFSFIRLLSHLADPSNRSLHERAKFELDVVNAARDNGMGKRGIPIPGDVLAMPLMQRGTGTISIATNSESGLSGSGGNLVATTLLTSSFVELLHNRAVALGLCSKVTDLVGNLDIPKEASEPEAYWIGENENATQSDATFSILSLSPKTIVALVGITRKMLVQPSMSMEAYVRNRIAKKLALGIDKAVFYGTGTNNQPTGIMNTTGISAAEFAADSPTFAELVGMETQIATDNADIGSLAYVANAAFKGYAKTTKKFSTSGSDATIWEPGNTVNGTRTEITNQIASGDILYGNFADVFIGLWAGMEILTERSVTNGSLKLSMFQDVDFKVLRGESFVLGRKKIVEESK